MLTSLLLAGTLFPGFVNAAEGVTLTRVFAAGEKSAYAVRASMTFERREGLLQTFLPEDLNLSYDFTTEVKTMKPDGVVDLIYRRPTMTEVVGDGDEPQRSVIKVDNAFLLTISPINEILALKEIPKPAKKKPPVKKGRPGTLKLLRLQEEGQDGLLGPFGPFIGEVHRLAVFIGPVDSALDFNPKFPFEAVKPGDTWKRTVSFQPQSLKGKSKQAVQRLDYVYEFQGDKTVNGKVFRRIQARLKLDTDLATYYHQMTESSSDESGLKSFPLTLTATIDFDLDPKTGKTVWANATSEGGFKIFTTRDDENPLAEERFKGTTVMKPIAFPAKPK